MIAADKEASARTPAAAQPVAAQPVAAQPAAAQPAAAQPAAVQPAAAVQTAAKTGQNTNLTSDSMFTRMVAGIDLSSASSLPTQQKVYAEFNLTAPIRFGWTRPNKNPDLLKRCLNALNAALKEKGGADGKQNANLTAATMTPVNDVCKELFTSATPQLIPVTSTVTGDDLQARIATFQDDLNDVNDPTTHHVWIWLNPRITSLPQTTSDLLTNVASSTPSFNSLAKANFNQVVQGLEVMGGTEWVLNTPGAGVPFGGASLSTSIFVSAGFITPFSTTTSNSTEFNLPPTLTTTQINKVFNGAPPPNLSICPSMQAPTAAVPCTNVVAYVPPDRTRFYYQYYTGIRLKTYFFSDGSDSEYGGLCAGRKDGDICPIFPGITEIGVGQNSAVSGGELRGWVLRTDANYALPFMPSLHLFFSSWIHLGGHNVTTTPVILDNTSPPVALTALGVATVPVEASNRDYYRLGMGIDLVALIKKFSKPAQPQTTTLNITTSDTLQAKVGQAINQSLAASGGSSPYTWKVTKGLPSTLTLDSRGLITGTPSAADAGKVFTVQVTDASSPQQTKSQDFTLVIDN
jgi:hypothetical protein